MLFVSHPSGMIRQVDRLGFKYALVQQNYPYRGALEMKSIVLILALSLAVCVLNSPLFCQETVNADTKAAKYVIYFEQEDAQLGASLFRVLIGADKYVRFEKAETMDKAIESDANVIVVVATGRIRREGQFNWKLDKESLDSLKKRKVIGIGYGASQLFEDMGLEIHGGNVAHFRQQIPKVVIVPNELIDPHSVSGPIEVLKDSSLNEADLAGLDVFAMHIPKAADEAKFVEVIARFENDKNYAPIVRQGNCILIGIPIQVPKWSKEYEHLIREICMNFHARHPEEFKVIERELAKPGEFKIDLAEGRSTDSQSSKDFYFRFDKPTKLSFELTHSGSQGIMMMFRGGNGDDTIRRDARDSAPLQIDVEISSEDIQEAGEKYWELHIVNFGREPVSCELVISPGE